MIASSRYLWPMVVMVALVLAAAMVRHEPYVDAGGAPVADHFVVSTHPLNYQTWARASLPEGWAITTVYPGDRAKYEALLDDTQRKRRLPAAFVPDSASATLMVDPLDADRWFRGRLPRVGDGPEGMFVVLMDPDRALRIECSYDLQGKRVGYFDEPERNFLSAVLHGYRMRPSDVELTQVPITQWGDLPARLRDDLDMMVAYVVPESPFHSLLKGQKVAVVGFQKIDHERVRLFHPYLEEGEANLQNLFMTTPSWSLVPAAEHTGRVYKLRLGLYHVQGGRLGALRTQDTREAFVTRLALHEESTDPGYRCYGDTTIESRQACASPYDPIGLRKPAPTVWDRPCFQDDDCPFYRANRNYSNDRGGCLAGGKCEMPTGVLRQGYRKYDDTGIHAPFCYACEDADDPRCCEDQKDRTQYWDIHSPDYAFPGDRAARQAAGLDISLPMK